MIKFDTKNPYLDSQKLLDLLSNYSKPNDKISTMLKNGELVRIKRGLYIPGDMYDYSYSKEVLANMIFGPSYISLEYALSYYGIIPERVETVTSITSKRNKFFKTPVGNFSYRYLDKKKYSVGVEILDTGSGTCLIAGREKALCDVIAGIKVNSPGEVYDLLFNDLRIDEDNLKNFRTGLLGTIKNIYNRKPVSVVTDWIITFIRDARRTSKKPSARIGVL